jgi:hypothetical protein
MNAPVYRPKLSGRWSWLFSARLDIYILILFAAFAAAFVHRARNNTIFACTPGYSSDKYLSYCGASDYGDYEHGAFWFGLEPVAEQSAARADVLFLGNSRTQIGFSTTATAQWFSSASASYYLLGFALWENSIFEQELLRRLKPRAKVYIINIPDFFQPFEAPVAKIIMHEPGARARYVTKRYLQFIHRAICTRLTSICGHIPATYRSRQTGMWSLVDLNAPKVSKHPVSYDKDIYRREIDDSVAIGQQFLSELGARPECVILTAVPYTGTKVGVANAIATGLDKVLVLPEQLGDLQTFDGNHLDAASAERWSEAFFKTAGPQIEKCLGERSSP